jgi:sugar phosphate isomerase/epimerase
MTGDLLDKISYFAVYDETVLGALQWASENGFTGVQVAVESPHLSYDRVSQEQQQAIRDFLNANRMRLILHAHDDAASLLQTNPQLRLGMYKYFQALFAFAERVGASMITLHVGSMTSYPTATSPEHKAPATDLQLYRQALKRNLDKIVELAARRFLLCAENCKLNQFVLDVLQPYLDDARISLCWDLPKMYYSSLNLNESLERFFRENIEHVKQVHLHDMNREGRSHRVIGNGEMEFAKHLAYFSEYEIVDYCIEVRPREKAKESLENLKGILGLR